MFEKSIAFLQDQSSKSSQRKKRLGMVIFFILILIMILAVPWKETWSVILKSDIGLIAIAFLLLLPTQILSAASFYIVAKSQSMQISIWKIFLINSTINFYEIVLPATFFGSGLRWYRYAQHSKKPAESFAAFAYLKIFTVFLALLLSFSFLIFFNDTTFGAQINQIGLLLAAVVLILFLLPGISQWLHQHVPKLWNETPENKMLNFLRKGVLKILQSFADFRRMSIAAQLWLILLGISGQLIQFFAYIFFARAVGIDLTYGQAGVLRAVLLLASNLPINFSPGIGLREVGLVALLVAMKVSLEQAVAMSALVFARTLFFGLLGGLIEGYEHFFPKNDQAEINS